MSLTHEARTDMHAQVQQDDLLLQIDEAVDRIGDRETYLEIAHYFASHINQSVASLKEALDAGNSDDAARLAHSLKGNCATVGAEIMRGKCLLLEKAARNSDMEGARALIQELEPQLEALGAKLEKLT